MFLKLFPVVMVLVLPTLVRVKDQSGYIWKFLESLVQHALNLFHIWMHGRS